MSIILGNCMTDIDNKFESCKSKQNIISNINNIINDLGLDTIKIDVKSKETIWIRDIYFIIDNECFLCNLTNCDTMNINRMDQKYDIIDILKHNYNINYIPKEIKIEGGDIIQSNNDIFIGIGKRTNPSAIKFLKTKFPDKNIIPIYHNSLHLDCIFAVLNNNQILYHGDYVRNFKRNKYEILDIKDYVKSSNPIPCNFLIYDDNIICSDLIKNEKLLYLLEILNYRVYPINIGNLWKEGGGIRCLTQWYTTLRSQYIY